MLAKYNGIEAERKKTLQWWWHWWKVWQVCNIIRLFCNAAGSKFQTLFYLLFFLLEFVICSLCVCEFYSIHSVPDPNITFFTLSFPSFTITSFLQFFSSLLFTSIYFMKHFYFFNGLLSFFLSLNKMEMILMTKMNGRADGQWVWIVERSQETTVDAGAYL